MPLFSIITACFNAHEELMPTERSLEQQVFRSFEWIVIDGGSVDGTVEFLNLNQNVTAWLSEPDEGIADAWNKGLSLCKGAQVLFLNAGDTYDKLMLETFSHHVSDKFITCCHARLGEDNSTSIFFAKPCLLWRGMHVPHNWCSVPMVKYKQLGGYEKLLYSMDFEWFARYYKVYGVSGFVVINKVLGQYGLGGYSDINYSASFKENERILVSLGMNSKKAKLLRFTYICKHFIRYRIVILLSRKLKYVKNKIL